MWRDIYAAIGAFLIGGYLMWSWMGWELGRPTGDPVPTVQTYASSSGGGYYGRSRGGYYGSGSGFGWGK